MTPSDSQGQRREHGPDAFEDDPTGIRDLLASLPEPGPMPEHLVERIEARLAVEQAHREQGSTGGLAARSDSVIDLAAERSHRRPGRTVALLGAAAAGLLVATVAIGEFAGVGPASGPAFDSAAHVPARGNGAGVDSADGGGAAEDDAGGEYGVQGGAADGSGQEAEGGSEGGSTTGDPRSGGDTGVGVLTDDLSADVLVLPELGVVDGDDFDRRIVELAGEEAVLDAGAAGSLTEVGARTCWETAGPADRWPTLRAAEGEMSGDRVVVLLGMRDAATGEALVLPWACTTGDDVAPLATTSWAP